MKVVIQTLGFQLTLRIKKLEKWPNRAMLRVEVRPQAGKNDQCCVYLVWTGCICKESQRWWREPCYTVLRVVGWQIEESCCLVGSTTKWRVWKEGKGSGVWNLVGMAEQKGLELSTSLFRTRRKEPIPTWNLGSVKLAVMVRAKILGLWPDFTVQNSCSSRVTQIIHHVSRLL